MTVSLVDTIAEVPGNLTQLEADLKAATTVPLAPAKDESAAVVQPVVDDSILPDKLKGKSLAEIADMYRNLESAYGRQSNDLGTQRKLTDRLLDLKREEDLTRNNPQAEPVKVDRAKLLEDPTAELDRFIASRDATRETESSQRLTRIEGTLAQQQFVGKHPDYAAVASDPGFVSWVQSSQFRLRIAQQAYAGDWGAADELVSEYKDRQKTTTVVPPVSGGKPPVEEATKAGLEAARGAALESSAAAGENTGKSGKQYRRTDLMELRLRKPDTYYDPAFQDEILKAYSEGRVK